MRTKLLLIVLLIPLSVSAQTVNQPSTMVEVASADDYASLSFQDPWDMDVRTDLGWFTYGEDLPFGTGSAPGFNNISFSGGIFYADTETNDAAVSILDTGIVGTAFLGKIGTNFPIDANKYTILCIRMRLSSSSVGQIFWSKNTIYTPPGGYSATEGFPTFGDWTIYRIDIPSLLVTSPNLADDWIGSIDSLRLDPTVRPAGQTLEIDWIRLVDDDASLNETVTWSGGGSVDIYLDDDNSGANGNLGTIARGVSGGSFTYNVGSLPPGDYYVAIISAGGNPASAGYSSGFYRVNDIPTLTFTSPSEEGSSDDFATVQLSNAWDMDSLADIDRDVNNSSLTMATVTTVEDDAGHNIGPLTLLKGVSIAAPGAGSGDPYVYPLWYAETASQVGRGEVYQIDSDRYRILVLKMGVPGDRNYNIGAHARIVWKRPSDGTLENVSEDVLLRTMNPNLVLNTIIIDMETLDIDPASPTFTGWNGPIDNFRVDAHEYPDAREYYIEDVKLAAFEKTSDSYVIRWNYSDNMSGFQTLSLFYDNDRAGFNGTSIVGGLNPTSGQYNWNNPPAGTHYIYAVYSDGKGNTNQAYARWPIVVDPSYVEEPLLSLDKGRLIFNKSGPFYTGAQKVRLSPSGAGTVNWTASSNRSYLLVSPGSGTDSGVLTIAIDPASVPLGAWNGLITISSSDASNAPRYVRVFGNLAARTPPTGSFDTPADGTMGISGAIAVTGWALDDIEVSSVQIYRDPVPGEGSSRVFIGDAVFVEGSRPDVEIAQPGLPFNYRSGWGYMLLTNFLPNQGNGTFTLQARATDKEGNTVSLGTKTITCDNAGRVLPFGTLDTPTQGGTAFGSSYRIWGWALTPQPNWIERLGSMDGSISVWVDGVQIASRVSSGLPRGDIQALFPGFNDTDTAVHYLDFDTTAYTNGVHIIYWIVRDNDNNADGIGSRYFAIENTGPTPP